MDKYYYVISQLPMLFFNRGSVMTVESFLEEAGKWLSARDLKKLSMIDINDSSMEIVRPSAWLKYQQFEYQFQSELAVWRKSRSAGQEYKPSFFPISIVKEGNPLEIEQKLLAFRWNYIEAKIMPFHSNITTLRQAWTAEGHKQFFQDQKVSQISIFQNGDEVLN